MAKKPKPLYPWIDEMSLRERVIRAKAIREKIAGHLLTTCRLCRFNMVMVHKLQPKIDEFGWDYEDPRQVSYEFLTNTMMMAEMARVVALWDKPGRAYDNAESIPVMAELLRNPHLHGVTAQRDLDLINDAVFFSDEILESITVVENHRNKTLGHALTYTNAEHKLKAEIRPACMGDVHKLLAQTVEAFNKFCALFPTSEPGKVECLIVQWDKMDSDAIAFWDELNFR